MTRSDGSGLHTYTFNKACSGYYTGGNKDSSSPSGTATWTAIYTGTQYSERTYTFSATVGQTLTIPAGNSQYGYHIFTASN